MLKEIRYAVTKSEFKKHRHLVRFVREAEGISVCGEWIQKERNTCGLILSEVGCMKCLASHEYRVVKKYGKRDSSANNIVLRT